VYYFVNLLFPEYCERLFETDLLSFCLNKRVYVSCERVNERTLFLLPFLLLLIRS